MNNTLQDYGFLVSRTKQFLAIDIGSRLGKSMIPPYIFQVVMGTADVRVPVLF